MTEVINISLLNDSELLMWDEYVLSHPEHSPYHLSAWGKATGEAYNQTCLFIAAKKSEQLVGILPLVKFKQPFKTETLCSLPFCDIGGVLASDIDIQQKLEAFASEINNNDNLSGVELRERFPKTLEFEEQQFDNKKVSMLLPLPDNSEELMASFKSKLRSQIRKAEKNGLTYELGRSENFIEQFYQVFSRNMHRLGSPVHSKEWFNKVVKAYQKNCVISIIKKDEITVGAGIILITNQKVCIPWASTLVEYNNLSPNMLLYWSLLAYSCDHGAKEFDFGRSTYKEGTYKFKAQWGAQPRLLNWRTLGCVEKEHNTNGRPSKLRVLVEKAWKKMPLFMANFIGPKLRRYISL